MAQDSLVKELLTDKMIHAGAELTKKLDELQWPVFASLWLYESEGNQWRLLIASERVTVDGPQKSYQKIQSALAAIEDVNSALALSDIGVTDPQDPLIRLLGMAIGTGRQVGGIRFKRNVINGHLIEDAYVYQIMGASPGEKTA
jgi:hypothetical protein